MAAMPQCDSACPSWRKYAQMPHHDSSTAIPLNEERRCDKKTTTVKLKPYARCWCKRGQLIHHVAGVVNSCQLHEHGQEVPTAQPMLHAHPGVVTTAQLVQHLSPSQSGGMHQLWCVCQQHDDGIHTIAQTF